MILKQNNIYYGTKLRYRLCKVQTAASAVGCGWMWREKLNKRKSDGGMTGDVCYRICNIDRSYIMTHTIVPVIIIIFFFSILTYHANDLINCGSDPRGI